MSALGCVIASIIYPEDVWKQVVTYLWCSALGTRRARGHNRGELGAAEAFLTTNFEHAGKYPN
jgi:hypothetical protein